MNTFGLLFSSRGLLLSLAAGIWIVCSLALPLHYAGEARRSGHLQVVQAMTNGEAGAQANLSALDNTTQDVSTAEFVPFLIFVVTTLLLFRQMLKVERRDDSLGHDDT